MSAESADDRDAVAGAWRPGPGDLVFIGGAGRSGAHPLARLLDRHPRFAEVPIEARFHCDRQGMPDLLRGKVQLEAFLDKLRDFWWHRVRADGQPRGLYNLLTRRSFAAAVERFGDAYGADPVAACRGLFADLLGRLAAEQEKQGLVEMSAHNLQEAPALRRLFGEARFIHSVRDGREAASSVVARTGGPDNLADGIDWWADRLRAIDAGVRGKADDTAAALSDSEVCVVVFDELVRGDREGDYERLLDFLGIDDAPGMQEFFELQMHPDIGGSGRWREGLGRIERRRVERRYEAALETLEQEGNHAARLLIDTHERLG